ncbi:hypothetical protein [Paenibacillus sp. y28]|uniref:hypothetical protein n=1 Tax=Paenibacillus sp. y28 TaxID=3129110 RepID=UPI003018D236
MNALYFFILSSIEFFSGLCLILTMFMFPIRTYLPHLVFTSLILTQTSYLFFEVFSLQWLGPVVQLFMVLLFFWLMFRIQLFYATIMGIVGYIGVFVIQILIIFFGELLHIITMQEMLENKILSYTMQLVNSAAAILISIFLKRYRIGFTFIPDSEKYNLSLRGNNLLFLIVMVIAAAFLNIFLPFVYGNTIYFPIFAFAQLIIFVILLLLTFKKEEKR